MKLVKRTFLRVFFGIEIVIFTFMYLFGTQGIRVLRQLQRENKTLDSEIQQLHDHVNNLEEQAVAWKSDAFYKEKVARERLHMARKNDVIFYTD